MSGHLYGEREPKENCPYCGNDCHADFVDVGTGFIQCGPYYCYSCKASQIGSFDTPRELAAVEQRTGWYSPGQPMSDKANTVGGRLVDHIEAKAAYRAGILDKKTTEEIS